MTWRRPSACETSACVEVLQVGDLVQVRNSRHPQTKVVFVGTEWAAFVAGVKAGDFDPLPVNGLAAVARLP